MEYRCHHEPSSNTVVATIIGQWNAEGSNQAWRDTLDLAQQHGADRILTDHRNCLFRPSTLDIYERSERLVDMKEYANISRLAILAAATAHLPSYQFFVTVMRNRGVLVEVFVDDETAAWNWLNQGTV